MQSFNYTTRITEDWAEIYFNGELTASDAQRIYKAGEAIIKSGTPTLRINLENCSSISVEGVGCILGLNQKINEIPGGILEIRAPQSQVRGAITVAGLDFLIVADAEEDHITQYLDVTPYDKGDQLVLTAKGSLNVFSVKWLVEDVRAWIEVGCANVVIDTSKISYMSSAGIRSLLLINKELRAASGSFNLINPSQEIRSILQMAGLESILISQ